MRLFLLFKFIFITMFQLNRSVCKGFSFFNIHYILVLIKFAYNYVLRIAENVFMYVM